MANDALHPCSFLLSRTDGRSKSHIMLFFKPLFTSATQFPLISANEKKLCFSETTPALSSSSRNSAILEIAEQKMNEQMTKIPSSATLSTSILTEDGTPDGTPAKFAEPQKPVLSNGQSDNRLTKTVPIKSASITTLPKSQAAQQPLTRPQTESLPLPTHTMTRLNLLNAGKAAPFTKPNVKQHADFKVKVGYSSYYEKFDIENRKNCLILFSLRQPMDLPTPLLVHCAKWNALR